MDFFTSDTHFFHSRIIELCNRPYTDVEEMNQGLINLWNETVDPKDTVYHLGDFSFGSVEKFQEIVQQLNGRKIIIRGNHDRSLKRLVELGFDEAHDQLEYGIGDGSFENPHLDFLMIHNPADAPKLGKYFAVLHGHVHDSWRHARTPEQKRYINVGVDVWNFKPVTLQQMLSDRPPFEEIKLIKDMQAEADEHRGK